MKPECKLIGENENVFNLICIVRKTLKNRATVLELEAFDCDLKKIQESGGNYDDVLILILDYVKVL